MVTPGATLDADGILPGVEFIPSPNCDERPPGTDISLAVVHAISLPPNEFGGDGVERLFTNRIDPAAHPYYATLEGLRVSAHFLIRRDGSVVQFVACGKRAWHAGASSWLGRERCNDFSIGIELEGCDEMPFETPQYEALAELIKTLAQRYPLRDIAGHADIAPGRKTDPGPCFEWSRLHALLLAIGAQHVVIAQR
jgi:AmpD protein